MSSLNKFTGEKYRVLGESLARLANFLDAEKSRHRLTETEVQWLLSQALTGRIAVDGKERGTMP